MVVVVLGLVALEADVVIGFAAVTGTGTVTGNIGLVMFLFLLSMLIEHVIAITF